MAPNQQQISSSAVQLTRVREALCPAHGPDRDQTGSGLALTKKSPFSEGLSDENFNYSSPIGYLVILLLSPILIKNLGERTHRQ